MRIRGNAAEAWPPTNSTSNLLLTVDSFRLLTAQSNAKHLVPSCR